MSHIGKKIGRDWLLYYDGLYNPNVEPYTYYSNDLLMDYDTYTMLRVRFNYWLTNKASVFIDIRNLTDYTDISRSITEPALGKQVIMGFDLEI